jgi:tripartite-type tricarboxylate transporter receptor subunit TctC
MSQAKLIFMAAVAAMQYAATSALAQITSAGTGAAYPAKSVRVIAGFPPASGAAITARVVGAKLYELMGQQFLVENRPGAGSNIVGNQGIEVLGGTPRALRGLHTRRDREVGGSDSAFGDESRLRRKSVNSEW